MSPIRYELVYATTSRATSLIDYNIYTDMHQQHEFKKQFILTDKLLTDNEKAVAIKRITETYDRNKVLSNTGSKRICETSKNNSETKTNSNYTSSSRVFTSKIHQFDNLPEPKNATEGEQEVDDFNNSSNQKTSKINNYFKASSKRLSKVFKKLQINSKNDIQNDNKKETIQQQIKGPINDEEVYDSPNLHSEEQDELEIPDEIPSDKLN
ncbi:kinase-like domain-containing protein [Rhizophagus irregularis DAOM 181602=DAOM 197198]|nr:kinase-like domain-containing protein [Rhizophagus irregularis DAOM 181602=DAOM 197198]